MFITKKYMILFFTSFLLLNEAFVAPKTRINIMHLKCDPEKNKINPEPQTPKHFYLPGFFEVFPELNIFVVFFRKENENACKTDADCEFPQACCDNPISPNNKFCCNGFAQPYSNTVNDLVLV